MDHFEYRNGRLHAEDVALAEIAERHGTPCYVYSRATLTRHYRAFDDALGDHAHMVCYAVKANSNLAVLQVLNRLGAGFDIVSGGELARVLKAGGDPRRVVFSGVGKTLPEIRESLLAGIFCFNVESESELQRLSDAAVAMKKTAPVALRVNPDVDPKTHPYISTGLKQSKFGIDIAEAERLFRQAAAMPGIRVAGVACHIGSQLLSLQPILDALDRVLALVDRLAESNVQLEHIDVGGGLGVPYEGEEPPSPATLASAVRERMAGRKLKLLMEPGRAIAANAGVLLTRVEHLKTGSEKNFAIVDAAMNDLLRPTLYKAWHTILPANEGGDAELRTYDVVGPVCESGDWLGKDRYLRVAEGDLLVVRSAGAYGFTMSSNYNTRPRAAEVMVDGSNVHVVRRRETIDDVLANESLLPG